MEAPNLPSHHRRVKFSYDEPHSEAPPRQKRPRFPKGKKASDLLYHAGEEDEGPVKATDPRFAAKERAVRRNQLTEQLLESEERSILTDITGAEEEYEDELEEEEDGIRIEPFNLKQEREEGFFDAEGNYVEYKNEDDTKDAWLESTTVDFGLAEKHLKKYAEEEQADTELSSNDLAVVKRRIANALEPGETVLQALRRLKGPTTERNHRAKMPDQTKALFDQLTEDAMKLLDNGDYNVYNEKKETFQREAEGYESLLRVRAGLSVTGGSIDTSVNGKSACKNEDIFADDDDSAADTDKKVMGGQVVDPMSMSSVNYSGPLKGEERVKVNDMFGENFDVYDSIGGVSESSSVSGVRLDKDKSPDTSGGSVEHDSGYVFDESSGYYYNSTTGYYYEPHSRLFWNAVSCKWYKFDEGTNMYVEVKEAAENTAEIS